MAIDEQRLLIEHYQIMEDIKTLKEDLRDGVATHEVILKRVIDLEDWERENHSQIKESLKKLEGSIVVMTPAQAKKNGENFFTVILKNPQYMMWMMAGALVLIMLFMGYSISEIGGMIQSLKE